MNTSSVEERTETRAAKGGRHNAIPVMHYWEVIWNRLHQEGWKLTHTTWTSPETGGVRHYVSAQRLGGWLEHSSPSMTETMASIARSALESDRADAAQAFRKKSPGQ